MEAPATFNNKQSALKNAQAMGACLEQKNTFLENWLMRDHLESLHSLPNAPCSFVGAWNSSRAQSDYKIYLYENGEFTAEPRGNRPGLDTISGAWGVHEKQMVWFYNQGTVWPPDINAIKSAEPNSFALLEVDGTLTTLTRAEADARTPSCGKSAAAPADKVKTPAAPAPEPEPERTTSGATVPQPETMPASAVAQVAITPPAVAAPAPAQPAPVQIAQSPAKTGAVIADTHSSMKPARAGRHAPVDRRYCLELASNYAIAKCAEDR
jgi:hypothetical protein